MKQPERVNKLQNIVNTEKWDFVGDTVMSIHNTLQHNFWKSTPVF